MSSQPTLRRAPILCWLLTCVLSVLLAFPSLAQNDVAPSSSELTLTLKQNPSASVAPRVGTPTFLGTVDTTLQAWNEYFHKKIGPYGLIAIALAAAYLTGLIIYQIAFGLGSFAPKAGLLAAWFSAIILLFFGLMMLPQGWPWWSPYALIFFGLVLTALILSSFSKKAV